MKHVQDSVMKPALTNIGVCTFILQQRKFEERIQKVSEGESVAWSLSDSLWLGKLSNSLWTSYLHSTFLHIAKELGKHDQHPDTFLPVKLFTVYIVMCPWTSVCVLRWYAITFSDRSRFK